MFIILSHLLHSHSRARPIVFLLQHLCVWKKQLSLWPHLLHPDTCVVFHLRFLVATAGAESAHDFPVRQSTEVKQSDGTSFVLHESRVSLFLMTMVPGNGGEPINSVTPESWDFVHWTLVELNDMKCSEKAQNNFENGTPGRWTVVRRWGAMMDDALEHTCSQWDVVLNMMGQGIKIKVSCRYSQTTRHIMHSSALSSPIYLTNEPFKIGCSTMTTFRNQHCTCLTWQC